MYFQPGREDDLETRKSRRGSPEKLTRTPATLEVCVGCKQIVTPPTYAGRTGRLRGAEPRGLLSDNCP